MTIAKGNPLPTRRRSFPQACPTPARPSPKASRVAACGRRMAGDRQSWAHKEFGGGATWGGRELYAGADFGGPSRDRPDRLDRLGQSAPASKSQPQRQMCVKSQTMIAQRPARPMSPLPGFFKRPTLPTSGHGDLRRMIGEWRVAEPAEGSVPQRSGRPPCGAREVGGVARPHQHRSVGRSVGRVVGLSGGLSGGRAVGSLVVREVGRSVGRPAVGRLDGRSLGWAFELPVGRAGGPLARPTRPTVGQIDRLNNQLTS